MEKKGISVILTGFNTRPLAFSLHNAGYDVYAVDFFGDLDLHPYVKDSIIIMDEIGTSYELIKDNYSKFLANFTITMLEKHPDADYLLIGSGLDNSFIERETIIEEIKKEKYHIKNINNKIEVFKKQEILNISLIY